MTEDTNVLSSVLSSPQIAGEQLQVFILGRFLVKKGDTVLSESTGRSSKAWELFKYFVVCRDSVLLPEVVAERLWPDQPYSDSKAAIRTMVHRLRTLLGNENNLIKFSQGGYILNHKHSLWLDAEAFEACCRQARQAAQQGRLPEAIRHYKQGLALYKGDLLPECAYSDWLIPHRTHYHRLYLQSVVSLAQLLMQTQSHAEIVEELTRATLVDYFEEEIHVLLLKALLAAGRVAQAKAHYGNVTRIYYREMGLKPSPAMKHLFSLIRQQDDTGGSEPDFSAFRDALQQRKQAGGAHYCEPEFFRFFCRIESRRAQRTGQNSLLLLLSVTAPGQDGAPPPPAALTALQEALQLTLRGSDCYSRFGDAQFIVLMAATTPQQGEQALRRISGSLAPHGLHLQSRLLPLNQHAGT